MERPTKHVTARWLAQQLAVLTTGVVVYFGVRGLTAGAADPAVENAEHLLRLERRLGLDLEDEAQALVLGSDALVDLANWVYIWGHWPVIGTTLVWLAVRHRTHYLRLRNAMFVSGLMGMAVFAAHPVAPPRLAGKGFVDTVTEQSHAYRVLQPPAFVNPYAALPSLHVGWDLLVGIVVVSAASSAWLRLLGRLMPLLMVVAVVVTGNHYVVDALVGAGFALVGLGVAARWERRRPPAASLPSPRAPLDDLRADRHRSDCS